MTGPTNLWMCAVYTLPKKRASPKENTPPSEPASQKPWPSGVAAIPTCARRGLAQAPPAGERVLPVTAAGPSV